MANGNRLGEGRELKIGLPTLAPMPNKDKEFSQCSSARLYAKPLCALCIT